VPPCASLPATSPCNQAVHTVPVLLGTDSYDITIGQGVLAALPDVLAQRCPAAHYAIITDTTVAALYGERVRGAAALVAPCDLFPAQLPDIGGFGQAQSGSPVEHRFAGGFVG